MKPLAFRVTNFRSVVDSGWVQFSRDGVTVFVGQNESGKTSLLEALHCAFGSGRLSSDDCRIGAPLPEVRLNVEVAPSLLVPQLSDYAPEEIDAVKQFLVGCDHKVDLRYCWDQPVEGKSDVGYVLLDAPQLGSLLEELAAQRKRQFAEAAAPLSPPAQPTPEVIPAAAGAPGVTVTVTTPVAPPAPVAVCPPPATPAPVLLDPLTVDDLATRMHTLLPQAVLFKADSGLLPNAVDIGAKFELVGEGAIAATNFLAVAGLTVQALLDGDRRTRETLLSKANAKVSADFNSFWSQVIGKAGKLELKCDLEFYSDKPPEKAGKPHLVFWICDGNTRLYPKQRSLGVRWFVSFYLQLKASEKSGTRKVFLLDEPGANLHSKAQADVLKVINKLSADTSVVYTTHSPHMIEYAKLYRVQAVQRDGEADDSPTVVITAHELGTASSDTLSPVLTAMGVDLTHQQVVQKKNNVLLEEMSAFYYLTAFWKLTQTTADAHFIATSGANKAETLASMFRGWGLDFIVAVDDDNQGRSVYKNLKRDMFGDNEVEAKKKLLKLPDCKGIEDAFSVNDFKKHVLDGADVEVTAPISEWLKASGRSKPVLAYQFMLKVESSSMIWGGLDKETQDHIKQIVEAIKSRLT